MRSRLPSAHRLRYAVFVMPSAKKIRQERHVIVNGFKPSGKLHLGNYVGSLQNCLSLQNSGDKCFFFIADYHQMAERFDPETNRAIVFDIAADMLAAGIDPKKCTLFVQSDVP